MGDLFELVRKDEGAKTIFSQFQSLPLLPSTLIESAFKELAKKALRRSPLFANFIDYFNREWIKIVKPKHFSVFMRGTRTTGPAESFNCQVNKRFKTHGNFFHFCEALQKEELVIAQQLENYIEGTVQREKQPKYLKKRNIAIKKYSLMLQNKEITPTVFLATMANKKNRILYADEDISLNDVEVKILQGSELYGGNDDVVYEEIDESSEVSDSDIDIFIDEKEPVKTRATRNNAEVMSDRGITGRVTRSKRNGRNNSVEHPCSSSNTPPVMGQVTRSNKNGRSNSSTSSNVQNESDTDDIFCRLTRSGTALNKIKAAINIINTQSASFDENSMECILGCGRNKAMLLLPCQHQHTCKECWLIWKIENLKKINCDVFNSSQYDDSVMQPKCPVCRTTVNKEIIAFN
ncbi:uncharacterized protein LOC116339967 [Contarinia nasturtii]|uniref:uncharacterized protein LOC116339967 n=1 Tax=Contarinia nasturtii TaxID=265458 RepID=UPI0012D3A1D2|nr:uncharacterized protein LOC116339967 [Contarinia nasturtii]